LHILAAVGVRMTAARELEAPAPDDVEDLDARAVGRLLAATLQRLRPDDGAPADWPPAGPVEAPSSPPPASRALLPAAWPYRRRPKRARSGGAVEVERAACDVCHEPAACAVLAGGAARICSACAISCAQLIASTQRSSARPHAAPCSCAACIRFDEGQRGEVARAVLLDGDADGAPLSRWSLLEVDDE
jgi:hypothetical protein